MMSSRLWRQVSQPDIQNPIVRRVSQMNKPVNKASRSLRTPRALLLLAAVAAIALLIHAPVLFTLVFALPIVMIALVVASPALLPLFTVVAGAFTVLEVINGIYREKVQHTYELICSSARGSLDANLSFAVGILHRGAWFGALRWGTLQSLRAGRYVFFAAVILAFLLLLSDSARLGIEQLHVLSLIALLLILYYAQLTQTMVMSLIIGLFTSSFDLSKYDASFVGICLYIFSQVVPPALALLFYASCGHLLLEQHPLTEMLIESVTVLIFILSREALIVLLWLPLQHRLNSSRPEVGRRGLAAVLGTT